MEQVTIEDPISPAKVDLTITSSTFQNSLTCITGSSTPGQAEPKDWVEDLIAAMKRLTDKKLTRTSGQGAVVVKSHALGGDNFTMTITDSVFDRCVVGSCAEELKDSQLGGAIAVNLSTNYQSQNVGIFDSRINNCRSGMSANS